MIGFLPLGRRNSDVMLPPSSFDSLCATAVIMGKADVRSVRGSFSLVRREFRVSVSGRTVGWGTDSRCICRCS